MQAQAAWQAVPRAKCSMPQAHKQQSRSCMVGSMKWVLQHKNLCLWYESMEYLQFLGGDFTPHGLEMQENTDE